MVASLLRPGDPSRLAEVLGIRAPILQSGMGGVAGPDLVAAVSEAGGLGVLAGLRLTPEQLRSAIGRVRELTDRPFGVNLWLHADVRVPPDPAGLPSDQVAEVQAVFNQLRPRFGLEPRSGPPVPVDNRVDEAIEVILAERVPVFSAAIGLPDCDLVERCHRAGTRVLAMVATAADAVRVAAAGVDVVVAQGAEAGGHRSHGTKLPREHAVGTGTFSLVPTVVAAVGSRIPVIAAGGVVDGRGLAAAILLGADGVLLGTRFVATRESEAAAVWKERLLGSDGDVVLSDGFTGQWAQMLRGELTDRWRDSGATALPGLLQSAAGADLVAAARDADDDQAQPLYAGASWSLLADLPGAGEVVTRLLDEAENLLGRRPVG